MLSGNVRELKMWLQEEKVCKITPPEDSEQSEVDYSQGESLKAWVSEGRESLSLSGEVREHCSRPAGLRASAAMLCMLSTELSCLYCYVGNGIYTRNHNKNHPKPIKNIFFYTHAGASEFRQEFQTTFTPGFISVSIDKTM